MMAAQIILLFVFGPLSISIAAVANMEEILGFPDSDKQAEKAVKPAKKAAKPNIVGEYSWFSGGDCGVGIGVRPTGGDLFDIDFDSGCAVEPVPYGENFTCQGRIVGDTITIKQDGASLKLKFYWRGLLLNAKKFPMRIASSEDGNEIGKIRHRDFENLELEKDK